MATNEPNLIRFTEKNGGMELEYDNGAIEFLPRDVTEGVRHVRGPTTPLESRPAAPVVRMSASAARQPPSETYESILARAPSELARMAKENPARYSALRADALRRGAIPPGTPKEREAAAKAAEAARTLHHGMTWDQLPPMTKHRLLLDQPELAARMKREAGLVR